MDDAHNHEHPEGHVAPKKRRFGIWSKMGGSALAFAVLIHVVILLIGAVWIFQVTRIPEKKIDFLPGGGGGGDRSAQKIQQKKRAQITPSTNVKRVFAEGAKSQYSIPDPGDSFGQMSALSALTGGGMAGGLEGAGKKGFGAEGIGNGSNIKLFGLIPETMGKRCSKDDRLQRLKENGGTPACEEAVVKGLRWLKANQAADGSWGSQKAAMTGLALLAYFGHCETPASEEFGDTVQRGIVYLVNLGMKNNGKMASNFTVVSWSYEHGIATYALAEAYTFCKELKHEVPNLREVTEKAGQFIIDNQNDNGGWAYAYVKKKTGHTDVSVVGWQIQSLKACSHTGITYRGMLPCIAKGLKYLGTCQNASGGFGYSGPNPGGTGEYFTLTGVGMLCNQMWGRGGAEVHKAAKYVLANSKLEYNTRFCDLYGHYYESQAMMQRGGDQWKQYNNMFRDQLLNNQDTDGSWKVCGGGAKDIRAVASSYVGDKVYRTCLCTLMMEVYYRFLSTGGGSMKERSGI
ncbi:MAG: prenyltransferase/squalene oxidase repeat-containing protein [Verrucomicrobiota bacterium]